MKNQPTFALALMFLLIISPVGYGNEYRDQDVVEQKTKGVINWSRGVIQAKGIGVLPDKLPNRVQARSSALKDATLDACRKILEVAKGIRIDGATVVGDYAGKNDIIMSKIESMVNSADVVKKASLFFQGKSNRWSRSEPWRLLTIHPLFLPDWLLIPGALGYSPSWPQKYLTKTHVKFMDQPLSAVNMPYSRV
jgi:hypothetical protein